MSLAEDLSGMFIISDVRELSLITFRVRAGRETAGP